MQTNICGRRTAVPRKIPRRMPGGMMKIYLVRHGETAWNQVRRFQGHEDIPLNPYGRDLAKITAEALKEIPFDGAFCSPLSRAKETAEIILRDRRTALKSDERLMEIAFGEGEGRSILTAKEVPEDPLYDFFHAPESFVPMKGGESFGDVYARTAAFVKEKVLPLEGTCENLLLVAHGVANRSILNPVLGIPMERFWEISLLNCAVSVLEVKDGALWVLEKGKTYD